MEFHIKNSNRVKRYIGYKEEEEETAHKLNVIFHPSLI